MRKGLRSGLNLGAVFVFGSALGLAGCGDDDDPAGTGASSSSGGSGGSVGGEGTGGSIGGAGGTGGAATVTYTVRVVSNKAPGSLEGAGVALDFVDGSRLEGLTSAAGRATIAAPADVELESVIAHKDGYSFQSYGANGETEWELGLLRNPASSHIAISGSVANMFGPATSDLWVAATPGTEFNGEGVAAYDLLAKPSIEFTLAAFELSYAVSGRDLTRTFENVWVSQQTGVAASAAIDIDFADPAPASTPFTVSVTAPSDPGLASTGLATIDLFSVPLSTTYAQPSSRGPLGGSTTCAHDALNGQYDCSGVVFDTGATAEQTIYRVGDEDWLRGGSGRGAVAYVHGGPPSGLVAVVLRDPPTVTTPTGPGPHAMDTVVEFAVSSEVLVTSRIYAGGRLVGVANPRRGLTSPNDAPIPLRVPELPSTSDAEAHYEASMIFKLYTCYAGCSGQRGSVVWEASPPAN